MTALDGAVSSTEVEREIRAAVRRIVGEPERHQRWTPDYYERMVVDAAFGVLDSQGVVVGPGGERLGPDAEDDLLGAVVREVAGLELPQDPSSRLERRRPRTVSPWASRPWGHPWAGDAAVEAAAEGVTEVGLRSGACFGMCPVYSVTLRRDGSAVFDGEAFVAMPGRHEAEVDPAAFRDLALAIEWLGFASLLPVYPEEATCGPSDWVWTKGGPRGRREVADHGSGPRSLEAIRRLIDECASALAWRPAADGGPGGARQPYVDDWGDPHWTQRPVAGIPRGAAVLGTGEEER